jgi:DNA-directed RNA polymerase specialized sigma24 family protein
MSGPAETPPSSETGPPSRAGGSGAAGEEAWFRALRARMIAVATRRVPAEHVEDVVQGALQVVLERGVRVPGDRLVQGRPSLAWCFQVLRHRIGNHYKHTRVRSGHVALDPERLATTATPLEALASADAARAIERALERLGRDDAPCGRYLQALAAGQPPRTLAARENVPEPVLYRRVYRCRQKLRALLADAGVLA